MRHLPTLLLLFASFACKPKPKVVVRAQRVVIKRISLNSCVLSVRYLIKNPHPVDLKVLGVHQTLSMDKRVVARGELEKKRVVGAKATHSIDVNVTLPYRSSIKAMGQLFLGKEVDYNLTSTMTLDTPLGEERRTLIRAGKLKLPLKPGGGLVGLKNVGIEGGRLLKIDLLVKIPRPTTEMMSTTRVSYKYSIEGSVISQGDLNLTKGGAPFQKVTIPISWPLAKGVTWSSKLLLGGELKTHFWLKMDLGEETDFLIDTRDTFSLKKLNPSSLLKKILK